jgi:transcriptional regulator GlxA family with amidase domain
MSRTSLPSSVTHPTNHPHLLTEATPLKIGVILFPGFQALDVFGPLDALNALSRTHLLNLTLLSHDLSPVSTKNPEFPQSIEQLLLPTVTFASRPALDVLLVPGGPGTRVNGGEALESAVNFIRDVYPDLKFLLTVCTGAVLAARAGVLDGKRATTNKLRFEVVASEGRDVDWVRKARWVQDGNVWTSSGVSAGIDMTLAWIGERFGEDVARSIADGMEYVRNKESGSDPFA